MAYGTMDELTIWSALIGLLLLMILYYIKKYSYWTKRNISGPRPVPFFGNLLSLVNSSLIDHDKQIVSKYGSMVGVYDMSTPVLLVSDPDVIQEVTIKKFNSFLSRRDMDGFDLVTTMLTATGGAKWKRLRKLMIPAFTPTKIRAMSHLMHGPLDRLLGQMGKSSEINLKKLIYKVGLQIIVRVAFGVELSDGPESDLAVYHATKVLKVTPGRMFLGLMLPLSIKKWLQFSIFEKQSALYFVKMVDAMIDQRKSRPDVKAEFSDFVDLMLEASGDGSDGDKLTRFEVLANCVLILVAGFETTSLTVITLLVTLAHNQDVQDRLRDEVKDVQCEDAQDLEKYASSLIYLDAVIKENLRMHPPSIRTERIASENVTLSNGLQLDEGTVVSFPINVIHRSQKYWANPNQFDPERFLPQNKEQLNLYAFMPFHIGPRNCIGERFAMVQIKLTIIKMMKQFKILPSPKTTYPLEFPNTNILLGLADQVMVKIEPLQSN